MLGDKIKITVESGKINIKNIGKSRLTNCLVQIRNIFYNCLLHEIFSLNIDEQISFNIGSYSFKETWQNEKIYVLVYENHELIFKKDFYDKTKCFLLISNEPYESLVKQMMVGLDRYSNIKVLHYSINYDSTLKFDNLSNIRINIEGNTKDGQYVQFVKPLVFLDVIEKGYKNIAFLDADMQVRPKIDNIFNYISELEDGPILQKAKWDYTVAFGTYIPGELLRNFMDLPEQKAPQGVTNIVLFSDRHYNLFKKWKEICFSKEIQEIRKTEFLHDELILNCLMWKLDIKQKLFAFSTNVINEKDVEFFYDFKNSNYEYEIDLNNYGLGHLHQSSFFYDKNELLAFHCIKDPDMASKVNEMILQRDFYQKTNFKNTVDSIYSTLSFNNHIVKKIENQISLNFNDGCEIQIDGSEDKNYQIKFLNNETNMLEYVGEIKNNMWSKTFKKFYVDWKIILNDGEKEIVYNLDLKNKLVKIINESASLGDFLAWVPIVDLFQKKHNCVVDFYTPNKELVEKSYRNINFYNYGEVVNKSYYATYKIGYFNNDNNKSLSPRDCRNISLQEIAGDILGIKQTEIKPKLFLPDNLKSKFNKKYVCIGSLSTAQAKFWNNIGGWEKVVDYLHNLGYEVISIDKYDNIGGCGFTNHIPKNSINKTGDLPLIDRINDLYFCDFFIGLGSGLSWLAWSLNKPVLLISGFSNPNSEFRTPYRIHNNKVCNSCWNDNAFIFDPSKWDWCPRNKNFECSREITFEMVKEKIDQCINDLKKSS